MITSGLHLSIHAAPVDTGNKCTEEKYDWVDIFVIARSPHGVRARSAKCVCAYIHHRIHVSIT